MNKIKEKIMKEFLENNAYFVDFFNAYFFGGERPVFRGLHHECLEAILRKS